MITVHCLPSTHPKPKHPFAHFWPDKPPWLAWDGLQAISTLRTQRGQETSKAIASLHPCVPGSQDVCLMLVYFFHSAKRKAPGNSFGYPAFPIHGKTLALKAGYTPWGAAEHNFGLVY